MSRTFSRLFEIGTLLGIAFNLAACSGKTIDETDPVALMKEAEEEIKSDHYQIALEKLKIIKNKFPYSSVAVDAQIRVADVFYLQESWIEAAAAYESFRDLHPKHPKTPYAMYRTAKSYFNDAPGTIARDLTTVTKALEAYQSFLKKFPDSAEAAEGRADVIAIRLLLAEKELYIANFYFKNGQYHSAKPRYEKILEQYPEVKFVAEAKEKLEKIEKMPQTDSKTEKEPSK